MESLEAILERVKSEEYVPNPDAYDNFARQLRDDLGRYQDKARNEKVAREMFEKKLQAAFSLEQRERYEKAGYAFERAAGLPTRERNYPLELELLEMAEANLKRARAEKSLVFIHTKMALCYFNLGQIEKAQDLYEAVEAMFEELDMKPTKIFTVATNIIPSRD